MLAIGAALMLPVIGFAVMLIIVLIVAIAQGVEDSYGGGPLAILLGALKGLGTFVMALCLVFLILGGCAMLLSSF
jgi:hypothetical protein